MRCDQSRDLVSARLDGEATDEELGALDRHLASCPACRDFASATGRLDRATRLTPADPVPDLTAAVMAAAPPPDLRAQREVARWSLAVVATAQLVLALPALIAGSGSDAPVHATRELGSWSVALAVGLLVAAWQPSRARGMLPLGAVLVGVLAVGAVVDVVGGRAGSGGEAVHLLELAGVALLWLLARRDEALTGRPALAR
jgi:predicted anti-sigma-YlaC factor YlaD